MLECIKYSLFNAEKVKENFKYKENKRLSSTNFRRFGKEKSTNILHALPAVGYQREYGQEGQDINALLHFNSRISNRITSQKLYNETEATVPNTGESNMQLLTDQIQQTPNSSPSSSPSSVLSNPQFTDDQSQQLPGSDLSRLSQSVEDAPLAPIPKQSNNIQSALQQTQNKTLDTNQVDAQSLFEKTQQAADNTLSQYSDNQEAISKLPQQNRDQLQSAQEGLQGAQGQFDNIRESLQSGNQTVSGEGDSIIQSMDTVKNSAETLQDQIPLEPKYQNMFNDFQKLSQSYDQSISKSAKKISQQAPNNDFDPSKLLSQLQGMLIDFQQGVKNQLDQIKMGKPLDQVKLPNPEKILEDVQQSVKETDIDPIDIKLTNEDYVNDLVLNIQNGADLILQQSRAQYAHLRELASTQADLKDFLKVLEKQVGDVNGGLIILFKQSSSQVQDLIDEASLYIGSSDNPYVQNLVFYQQQLNSQFGNVIQQTQKISSAYTKQASDILKDVLPDNIEGPLQNVYNYVSGHPIFILGVVGVYTSYSLVNNYLKDFQGYAGVVDPLTTYDKLMEGNSILVDIRSENDLVEDGLVDLKRLARGNVVWVPRYNIKKQKYGKFKQGQQIEAYATAEILLGTKDLPTSYKIYVMPSSQDNFARDVARAFTSIGYRQSFVVQGGFQNWVQQELPVKEVQGEAFYDVTLTDTLEDLRLEVAERAQYLYILSAAILGTSLGGIVLLNNYEVILQYIGVFGIISTLIYQAYQLRSAKRREIVGKQLENYLANAIDLVDSLAQQNKIQAQTLPQKASNTATQQAATTEQQMKRQEAEKAKQAQQQLKQEQEKARLKEQKQSQEMPKEPQAQQLQQQKQQEKSQQQLLQQQKEDQKQKELLQQQQQLQAQQLQKQQQDQQLQQRQMEAKQKEEQQKDETKIKQQQEAQKQQTQVNNQKQLQPDKEMEKQKGLQEGRKSETTLAEYQQKFKEQEAMKQQQGQGKEEKQYDGLQVNQKQQEGKDKELTLADYQRKFKEQENQK